ncbi:MAG: HD domain-containing protein [Rhizobiales bacterium]|nr:HD domain-containing protein [Hyphomicrobiales bacterium]
MNDLRKSIVEDLPEIEWISDPVLRQGAIDAWALALEKSSFSRISEIPGEANPGIMVMRRGGQQVHLSGVTRLALASVDYFADVYPEAVIDRDVVICGGLCHDVGKAWECDPENQKRWKADASLVGRPSLRHPVYGAYICLTVGLPESVAHIAACHSPEGDNVKRSLECIIVHEADVAWWKISAASGLTRDGTIPDHFAKMFEPRKPREMPRAAE